MHSDLKVFPLMLRRVLHIQILKKDRCLKFVIVFKRFAFKFEAGFSI